MSEITIAQNMDQAIEIMYNVGCWMETKGLKPSIWWKPENMNLKFMKRHAEPDEFFVAVVDGKPVASVVLQESERNQSWKSVDGNDAQKALYIHWLCVHRDFAGTGLPLQMIDFANKEAKRRGFVRLRLDTDAREKKLCKLYEDLGFQLVGVESEKQSQIAFFEKLVN